jgi:hypothetical protein
MENSKHSEQRSEAEENKADVQEALDDAEKAVRVALKIKTGIKAGPTAVEYAI